MKDTDQYIYSLLKSQGLILPKTEEELRDFEDKLDNSKIPPIPKRLETSEAILNVNYSKPNILRKDIQENNWENLARAARDGKPISNSVLDKMRKDREDAEKK